MRKIIFLFFLSLTTGWIQAQPVVENCAGTGALNPTNFTSLSPSANIPWDVAVRKSGTCAPTTIGGHSLVHVNGTFSNDQIIEMTYAAADSGDYTGPLLRLDSSGNGIQWLYQAAVLYIIVNGAGTGGTGISCPVVSVGDATRYSVIGTTYTCANLTTGLSNSGFNSTYPTGNPGFQIWQGFSPNTSAVSNITARNFTSLSLSPSVISVSSIGNVIALTGVGTTWNSSCPVFTLTGGTGASITAHSCSSDTTASITVNAGSSSGNLTITDPSTTSTANLLVHSPTNYYQRDGGGDRYSTNNPTGRCNGMADVDDPGSGVNQPCAFKYVRMGWADGTYTASTNNFPAWGWIMLPGDNFIIHTHSTGQESRIGWSGPNSTDYQYGIVGDPGASGMPPPPDNTAVLGENYANCNAGNRTKLHAGYGAGAALATDGSKNIHIVCLDVTDFAQCGKSASAISHACQNSFPLDDFAQQGMTSSNTNVNVTIDNVSIHGFSENGIKGPNGDNFQLLRSYIGYNSTAGINQDAGNNTADIGTILIQDTEIEAAGCIEVYPNPGAYAHPGIWCTDQTHGGYGDCIGTATITGTAPTSYVILNRSRIHNCTQDGPDFLHGAGPGSSVTIKNSYLYSNMGQQAKLGGVIPTFFNTAINGNNQEMCTPGGLPGWPTNYPAGTGEPGGPYLTDCGRGGQIDVLFYVDDSYTSTIAYNSINSNSGYSFYMKCSSSCVHPVIIFQNNAFQGNLFTSFGVNTQRINADETPQGFGIFGNPGSILAYNVTNGDKNPCPAMYETNYICAAPGYTSPSWQAIGIGNYYPASGASNIVAHGTPLPSVTTIDLLGNARSATLPTVGAFEYNGMLPMYFIPRKSGSAVIN